MIQAAEINRIFDLISDEVQTDYFTTSEKSDFFNQAQLELFHRLLTPDNPTTEASKVNAGYQSSLHLIDDVAPFVHPMSGALDVTSQRMWARIFNADMTPQGRSLALSTGLQTNQGAGWYPSTSLAHYEITKRYSMGSFFKFDACNPGHSEDKDGIYMLPNKPGEWRLMAVVYPQQVDIDGNVGSEFPQKLFPDLIHHSLRLAGVAIRDEGLIGLLDSYMKLV